MTRFMTFLPASALALPLIVGVQPTTGEIGVTAMAQTTIAPADVRIVNEKRVRIDEEKALKRQNRRYARQATRVARQYDRRAQRAENAGDSQALTAVANYYREEAAKYR